MVYFLCKAYDSDRQNCYFALSLPVRGAWIEILTIVWALICPMSLPVRGAWIEMPFRGRLALRVVLSLPVRGAWIEISQAASPCRARKRRSPCGERGLKYAPEAPPARECCRSPCGERGLKYQVSLLIRACAGRSPCGERGLK